MRARFRPLAAAVLAASLACSSGVPGDAEAAPAADGRAVREAAPRVDERETRTLAALQRSIGWLENNPVDPTAPIGRVTFDAWSWFLFSRWHPDASVREGAGVETDRRLRALRPPTEWNQVSLSYWAVLKRIATLRGVDLAADPPLPDTPALAEALRPATPTTAYWTKALLQHAGVEIDPATDGLLVQRGPAIPPGSEPTVADAYGIFHELVPLTGLTTVDGAVSKIQMRFIRETFPGWIEVCRAKSDTDCIAELLVVAALIDERTPLYDASLEWLLERQRPDGAYVVAQRQGGPDEFRHVVLVASWALLASLDTFETRVGILAEVSSIVRE